MKIQNASFTMIGRTYANARKESKQNSDRVGNTGKDANTGSPSVVIQLSSKSQFNGMIEKIQEQIQKIKENEHYDADTKKAKIKELEKQIVELEKAQAAEAAETMLGKNKDVEKNDSLNTSNNTTQSTTNSDGDILELNTTALLQADNSLKNLKDAHSMKVRSEGNARVLESEIKIDKGRGVDTTRKEEQLNRIQETTQKSIANMGEAIQDVNNAAQKISEGTESGSGVTILSQATGKENT